MTAISNAPMMVPVIVPSPPKRLVPPMTTAAIASSSAPFATVGCAELSREVSITPAIPADSPIST
jgi:hypothetical protein